jgi:hypothetical protein
MTPDFSPRMLALFLRARAEVAVMSSREPWRRTEIVKAKRRELRDLAGVTGEEMRDAWAGTLRDPGPRAALWAVLGHFPVDHGITLTPDGQHPAARGTAPAQQREVAAHG